MTTLIPDYQVPIFLETVAPGKNITQLARMLDVHRNTVARWQTEGMPVKIARMLFATRLLEIEKRKAEIEALEAELRPLIEEHGL